MRAALAAPERSQENKARDAARKPIETVQFLGIKTGDTVVDMIAESGWFTEVLVGRRGPEGTRVHAESAVPRRERAQGHDREARQRRDLARAVRRGGPVGKVDAVVTAMNLHDIYNGFGNQPAGEAPAVELR